MTDYSNLQTVLELLSTDREADKDRREMVREIEAFLDAPDGQWEPDIVTKFDNFRRPRYTFDRCNPLVDDIWRDIAQNDFDIRVRPASGEATKSTAKKFDGLIRNIETISNAASIYKHAGKKVIRSGFAAWRVTHKEPEDGSFNRELRIESINNAVDRVWFDSGFELQTAEDAGHAFIVSNITEAAYNKRFPGKAPQSIDDDATSNTYHYKRNGINIAEIYFKKEITSERFLMSDGSELDESEKPIFDELAEDGITVVKSKKWTRFKIVHRTFDGKQWLSSEQDTVFSHLPVIPVYSNFSITENKVIYRGVIEKRMDEQRILNYSGSKAVEEVALAPREKIWMTQEQAVGNEKALATMNNNSDPVQIYNHVEGHIPPYKTPGPQINPGVSELIKMAEDGIERGAGTFAANPQHSAGLNSGIALERLEDRGNDGSYEYFDSLQVAICHTAKVLVSAIPKGYSAEQKARILNEDGSYEIEPLYQVIKDEETGAVKEVIDLTKGTYDVTCEIGPAFKSRQQETVRAIMEIGSNDQTVIAQNKDILLNNLDYPGMDIAAERARYELLKSGQIPETQLTEEEKAQIASQPQQPDPMMIVAQAEAAKAQAQQQEAQTQLQIKLLELELKKAQQDFDHQARLIELEKEIAQTEKEKASAAKLLADARAQELETDLVESGLMDVING